MTQAKSPTVVGTFTIAYSNALPSTIYTQLSGCDSKHSVDIACNNCVLSVLHMLPSAVASDQGTGANGYLNSLSKLMSCDWQSNSSWPSKLRSALTFTDFCLLDVNSLCTTMDAKVFRRIFFIALWNFSLNPPQHDILPHRQSQLSDLTIRLHNNFFEVCISNTVTLSPKCSNGAFTSLTFSMSRDQSFFVLIG